MVGRWLRLTLLLLFVGYAWACSRWPAGSCLSRFAFLAALLTILNPQALFLSDISPPTCRTPRSPPSSSSLHPDLGAGLLAVAAYGLRAAGVALLAAWTAESLLRRRCRQAVARGGRRWSMLGAWQVYVAQVKSDPAFAEPAYAYQRADYQFYNVGYVENMAYMDPFRPELGRATARQLAARVWTTYRGCP